MISTMKKKKEIKHIIDVPTLDRMQQEVSWSI